jgi:polyisoprenoid-binding protein YceI
MSTPATQLQAASTGHYAIDSAASSVTFVTRHIFGLARVRGTFPVTCGGLTVAETAEQASVTAGVSSASFSTRNFLRAAAVPGRWTACSS